MAKIPLAIITGPTASGKSTLALGLARYLQTQGLETEIICCDSMLIYRGLNIGTDKPSSEIRNEFAHHVLDLREPSEEFSVGDYLEYARRAIEEVRIRGHFPLVVGGTGLYVRALTHGLLRLPRSLTQSIEHETRLLRQQGQNLKDLYARLERLDPQSARRIHPNDAYRTTRALAVHQATGQPLSFLQENHGFRDSNYDSILVGLQWERQALYERIDERVREMVAGGLETEVQSLLDQGFSPELRPLQGLAYRWYVQAAQGDLSMAEALSNTQRDSRHFAKRQMTWFRPLKEITWISGSQPIDEQIAKARHLLASALA